MTIKNRVHRVGMWSILVHIILLFICTDGFGQKAVLSSRWFHPISAADTLSTLKVIKLFKPDRLDWTYTEDQKTVSIYKGLGIPFSLAINPQFPDSAGYTSKKSRIKDIDETVFVAPWMKSWKITNPYWGCVNNPFFVNPFKNKVVQLAKLGAYAIFVDDALFNVQLQNDKPNKHGCFCDYCIKSFLSKQTKTTEYKNRKVFITSLLTNRAMLKNYELDQQQAVVRFLTEVKKLLANNRSKLLVNNPSGKWNNIYKVADGGIAELELKNLNIDYLTNAFATARNLGKSQVFSLSSEDSEAQKYLIAYCYWQKKDYLIPWDIFIKDQTRFYMDLTVLKTFLDDLPKTSVMVKSDGMVLPADFRQIVSNKWYSTYTNGVKKMILLNNNTKT